MKEKYHCKKCFGGLRTTDGGKNCTNDACGCHINKEIVILFWKDAAMHGTEQVTETDAKDYGIMSGMVAGWFVNEDKEQITVAMDFFPAQTNNSKNCYRTLQSYPKSGIYQIIRKEIRPEKKTK